MKVFQVDGLVYRILNKITDLLLLSVIYTLCCLPVITIGASTTALYYAVIKLHNDEGYPMKNFFKSFKENFRQATCIWVPAVIVFGVIILNVLFITGNNPDTLTQCIWAVNAMLLLIFSFLFTGVYPILSRYSNSIRNTLLNGIIIGLRSLPWMTLIYLMNILPLVLCFFIPEITVIVIVFWGFFGFALTAYLAAWIYEEMIFSKYMI